MSAGVVAGKAEFGFAKESGAVSEAGSGDAADSSSSARLFTAMEPPSLPTRAVRFADDTDEPESGSTRSEAAYDESSFDDDDNLALLRCPFPGCGAKLKQGESLERHVEGSSLLHLQMMQVSYQTQIAALQQRATAASTEADALRRQVDRLEQRLAALHKRNGALKTKLAIATSGGGGKSEDSAAASALAVAAMARKEEKDAEKAGEEAVGEGSSTPRPKRRRRRRVLSPRTGSAASMLSEALLRELKQSMEELHKWRTPSSVLHYLHEARHDSDDASMRSACRAVAEMATMPGERNMLCRAGVAPVIVHAMEAAPEDSLLQEWGCCALRNLTVWDSGDDTHKMEKRLAQLMKLGTVRLLVNALRGSASTRLHSYGCGALRNMARHPEASMHISSNGGIDVVLSIMRRWPEHSGVQEACTGCLRHMLEEPRATVHGAKHRASGRARLRSSLRMRAQSMVRKDVIRLLLSAMSACARSDAVQRQACRALALLGGMDREFRQKIIEADALPAVLHVLRAFLLVRRTALAACMALQPILCGKRVSARECVRSADMRLLLDAIQQYGKDGEAGVAGEAAKVVRALISQPPLLQYQLTHGVAEQALRLHRAEQAVRGKDFSGVFFALYYTLVKSKHKVDDAY